jgi:hypothetical protein
VTGKQAKLNISDYDYIDRNHKEYKGWLKLFYKSLTVDQFLQIFNYRVCLIQLLKDDKGFIVAILSFIDQYGNNAEGMKKSLSENEIDMLRMREYAKRTHVPMNSVARRW